MAATALAPFIRASLWQQRAVTYLRLHIPILATLLQSLATNLTPTCPKLAVRHTVLNGAKDSSSKSRWANHHIVHQPFISSNAVKTSATDWYTRSHKASKNETSKSILINNYIDPISRAVHSVSTIAPAARPFAAMRPEWNLARSDRRRSMIRIATYLNSTKRYSRDWNERCVLIKIS